MVGTAGLAMPAIGKAGTEKNIFLDLCHDSQNIIADSTSFQRFVIDVAKT